MDSIQIDAGAVCVLTIDRPHARNSISRGVIAELREAIGLVSARDPHALIIRGAGERAFVAGGDVKDFDAIRDLEAATAMASDMRAVLDQVESLSFPVVAAINGVALGGGMEVAVACDFRLAVDDAVLAFNQVLLGITPAWGGIERVVRQVGPGRASWLLLTGTRVTASEALSLGLIESVVPRRRFDDEVAALADMFAALPRHALTAIKAGIASTRSALPEGAAAAAIRRLAECWVDDDHWKAMDRSTVGRDGAPWRDDGAVTPTGSGNA